MIKPNKITKLNANTVGAHDCARKTQNISNKPIANIVGAGLVSARDHRGITLVALIITIIIMLILLGVTVNIALNGGLFGMTKEAVKKTEIAAYKEKIDAVRINIIVEQISKGLTTEEFMNRYEEELRKDKNFEGSEITREGETIILTTKEGYVFEITEEGTNYEGDTDAPETPETPKDPPSLSKNNITYEPETWTQGPVTVTISTTEEGYTLEYRIVKADGTIIQDWTAYSEQLTIENNGTTVYARLKDESSKRIGGVATANITNIDRLDPDSVTISSIEKTTNSIKVVAEATDADAITTGEKTDGKSEIAKYYFSKDNGATWEPEEGQASGTYTFEGLTHGQTYKIKVKAEDNATNQKETVEAQDITTEGMPEGEGSINFSYSNENSTDGTINWTNQAVNVTITKASGVPSSYTLQYTTDDPTVEDNWKNYSDPVSMSDNDPIYARLVDSVGNAGAHATGNVTKIDQIAPTVTASVTSTAQGNKITLTFSDNAKNGNEIKWAVCESKSTTNASFDTTQPNSDGTWSGTFDTSASDVRDYYIYAKDSAGNITADDDALKITITEKNLQNETTKKNYTTLQEAFNEAKNGEIIGALDTFTDDSNAIVKTTIGLDLKDHKITKTNFPITTTGNSAFYIASQPSGGLITNGALQFPSEVENGTVTRSGLFLVKDTSWLNLGFWEDESKSVVKGKKCFEGSIVSTYKGGYNVGRSAN